MTRDEVEVGQRVFWSRSKGMCQHYYPPRQGVVERIGKRLIGVRLPYGGDGRSILLWVTPASLVAREKEGGE